jgi:hypothetical protein
LLKIKHKERISKAAVENRKETFHDNQQDYFQQETCSPENSRIIYLKCGKKSHQFHQLRIYVC